MMRVFTLPIGRPRRPYGTFLRPALTMFDCEEPVNHRVLEGQRQRQAVVDERDPSSATPLARLTDNSSLPTRMEQCFLSDCLETCCCRRSQHRAAKWVPGLCSRG